MIKKVRDDVIKLESYVAAAFKYDEELTKIFEVGGYCLVSQLKSNYGESKAKRIIEDMQQHKLLATEYYSNSKYAYITQNTLKYLANKDNQTEQINIKKRNIEKYPAEKVLIASILKYQVEPGYPEIRRTEYIKQMQQKIIEIKGINKPIPQEALEKSKEKYIKSKEGVTKLINLITQCEPENETLKNIIRMTQDKYQETLVKYDDQIKQVKKAEQKLETYTKGLINLYDISKQILLPVDNETLKYYIIDYTKIKSLSKYFSNIYKFEKTIGKIFKNINIYVISYKRERYRKFANKLKKYLKENKTIRNIEIIEIDTCYHLERIIERTNYIEKETLKIKPKDKQAYKKIKAELNKND
ncbi:hypothetical protein JYG23_12195 [Sedimentibacter sp. zth1]|uniref:hypothetical protein n=1 Tax=Sedimentibacter sp. zth1 TaxID=2816908 RepID=UPI001A92B652|nr:hypothetical protein [Sedimentibacter sp. zth1]QSX05429.1 hypothetical protein JYG23_12195 [Sedimentibacter sp. zth1]